MQPPFILNSKILQLVSAISEKIGEVNATFLTKQSPQLRNQNRIKTIQSSLAIEGNTLTMEQITAIVDNKRVLGPQKDILEVTNAIKVYEQLHELNPFKEKSFFTAHKILMEGLVLHAEKYRNNGVGIVKGSKVTHIAPPAKNLTFLMKDLFSYLKKSNDLLLLKSCVFHYEIEFIHPFADGNGRMGRLWQTLLLMKQYPVFEYMPFETLISKNQQKYYDALSASDKQGNSTFFIEFILQTINESLLELLTERPNPLSSLDCVLLFLSKQELEFTRKDYISYFKKISTATASRDLKMAVDKKLILKEGDKNKTTYKVLKL